MSDAKDKSDNNAEQLTKPMGGGECFLWCDLDLVGDDFVIEWGRFGRRRRRRRGFDRHGRAFGRLGGTLTDAHGGDLGSGAQWGELFWCGEVWGGAGEGGGREEAGVGVLYTQGRAPGTG